MLSSDTSSKADLNIQDILQVNVVQQVESCAHLLAAVHNLLNVAVAEDLPQGLACCIVLLAPSLLKIKQVHSSACVYLHASFPWAELPSFYGTALQPLKPLQCVEHYAWCKIAVSCFKCSTAVTAVLEAMRSCMQYISGIEVVSATL